MAWGSTSDSTPYETHYYDILECEPTATAEEIRRSYRRLALLHHPDKPTGSAEKFQSIQEAWEILSDDTARRDYDRFGRQQKGHSAPDQYGDPSFDFFGYPQETREDREEEKRRKEEEQWKKPSIVRLDVTLEEAFVGATKTLGVERARKCTTCKATGGKSKARKKTCSKCKGKGRHTQTLQMGPFITQAIIECETCKAQGSYYHPEDYCKKCEGKRVIKERKKVEVNVKRGVKEGERVTLYGEGDQHPDAPFPADLIFVIHLSPHPTFRIIPSRHSPLDPTSPNDLQTTISITLSESLLGFSRVSLRHLDSRHLRISSPSPSALPENGSGKGGKRWRVWKDNEEIRLPGEGMTSPSGRKGDLWVKVEIEYPTSHWAEGLGEEGVKELEKLLPGRRADGGGGEEVEWRATGRREVPESDWDLSKVETEAGEGKCCVQ